MTAYFLVSTRQLELTSSTVGNYGGVDRSPWKCVDNLVHSSLASPGILAARRASFTRFAGNLSFGTFESLQEVRHLAMSCECCSLGNRILAVRPVGTIDQVSTGSDLRTALGFDIYVDGYGSPIALGMEKMLREIPELDFNLTKTGLLSSLSGIQSFWVKYVELTRRLDLEPLSNVSPPWVYEVIEELGI